MVVYFLIIFMSLQFAYMGEKIKCKINKDLNIFYFLAFIVLFLFSALRYDVGYDYMYTYVPKFYQISYGYDTHFEYLFVLLNKFVYLIFGNVDWLFIICSFITLYIVYKAIRNQSVSFIFSIFLLVGTRFYFYSFTQVRQYITIAIFLYSIKYIVERDFFKYTILILISTFIHKLSILYFPIYFICNPNIKLSKFKYTLFSLSAIFLGKIFSGIFRYFAIKFYSGYEIGATSSGDTSSVFIIIAIFISILTIIYYNSLVKEHYYVTMILMQLCLIVVIFATNTFNDNYRVVALLSYHTIFLVPKIYKIEKNPTKKLLLITSIILIYTLAFTSYLITDASMTPYKTIFNK